MEETYPNSPVTPSRKDLLKALRAHKTDATSAILYGDVEAALRRALGYQLIRASLARLEASEADKLAAKINKMIGEL